MDSGDGTNQRLLGVRQGDWKLIWRAPLSQVVELYKIAPAPAESK
jgi:hypothetical protein